MPVNYEALRTGSLDLERPTDGEHTAYLDRAALVETKNGSRLVTEWSELPAGASWSSWNRFDEVGLPYTIELLDGLGVDRSTLADDVEFQDSLDSTVGQIYNIRTTSQTGKQGDRVFITTFVDGRAGVAPFGDIPADTEGLPDPNSAAAQVAEPEQLPWEDPNPPWEDEPETKF